MSERPIRVESHTLIRSQVSDWYVSHTYVRCTVDGKQGWADVVDDGSVFGSSPEIKEREGREDGTSEGRQGSKSRYQNGKTVQSRDLGALGKLGTRTVQYAIV